MMRRENEKKAFYQWDLDQHIILPETEGSIEAHFWQEGLTDAMVVEPKTEDGQIIAAVPNILLQKASPIKAYIYRKDTGKYTAQKRIFQVLEREKPADYVYTETEVKSWDKLSERMNKTLDEVEEALDEIINLQNDYIGGDAR